jgi:hypothetical protein
MSSYTSVANGVDLWMIGTSAVGIGLYLKGVPLPYRSYGGRMAQNTYFMPLAVFGLFKALQWFIGVDTHVGSLPRVVVGFLGGTALMFVLLGVDPDQSGPGVFIAFLGGAFCSLAVPLVSSIFMDSRTALLLTEAGVPMAVGYWWALGRLWHSD